MDKLMPRKKELGRIFTFYSFKGGVGRTMAVANLAFVAANNGKRVLVMDWDMEAPGLAYYFRGLTEPSVTRELREAPGILNILWRWRNAAEANSSEDDSDSELNAFKSGGVFSEAVRPIVSSRFIGESGCVDYIGAGSSLVETPTKVVYQEALARFNWADFYESRGGGYFVESLRKWAKTRYDLILIDSRTGFADAAGVCTMQLPDVVALCFVLNRQNIDGTATVAGAVRQSRGNQLTLRAVPMRTSRIDSPEQSDAMARAMYTLKKTGKFGAEEVEKDLKDLAILSADSIPFYETLAPFAARSRTSLDPLFLNYVQVASTLFETPLAAPDLPTELIESVQAMLEPKNATVDFVRGLVTAEPARAATQLERLLQGALQSLVDGEMPTSAYVEAMVDLSFHLENEGQAIEEWLELQRQVLDLLRQLYKEAPEEWVTLRLKNLERSLLSMGFYFDDKDEIELLLELEDILSEDSQAALVFKRIEYLRQICRTYLRMGNAFEELYKSVSQMRELFRSIRPTINSISEEENDVLLAAELDACLLEAHLLERQNSAQLAEKYLEALSLVKDRNPNDADHVFRQLASELYLKLFSYPDAPQVLPNAVQCAVEAGRWGATWFGFQKDFPALAHKVATDGATEDVQKLLSAAVDFGEGPGLRRRVLNYVARNLVTATKHVKALSVLLRCLTTVELHPSKKTLQGVEQVLTTIFNTIIRRPRPAAAPNYEALLDAGLELASLLNECGQPWKNAEMLIHRLQLPPTP
jgi:tetratricopeptide (TPR) repeat protein